MHLRRIGPFIAAALFIAATFGLAGAATTPASRATAQPAPAAPTITPAEARQADRYMTAVYERVKGDGEQQRAAEAEAARVAAEADQAAEAARQADELEAAARSLQSAVNRSLALTPAPVAATPAPVPVSGNCFGVNAYAADIYSHESGCQLDAVNGGGCAGIGQACPGSKLPCSLSDAPCQLAFFEAYMQGAYGSWEAAYNFRNAHNWW